MNYLLDTHAFIWAITDRSKLSVNVKNILQDAANNISVSAVSFWEISLKFGLGKIELQGVEPNQLPSLSQQAGFRNIPLLPVECAGYHFLKTTHHKDPFDRMLIWQAIKQNLIFITKDSNAEWYHDNGVQIFW